MVVSRLPMAPCHIPKSRANLPHRQAFLCVIIGYTLVGPLIVLNARPGAIFGITFPVVNRTTFGLFGSLWPVLNREWQKSALTAPVLTML